MNGVRCTSYPSLELISNIEQGISDDEVENSGSLSPA